MTLQLLKGGFPSCNDLGKLDSNYKAFRSVDQMYNARLRKIDSISIQTMETKSRCYQYGLYQALILDRIIPGWKAFAQKDNKTLDQIYYFKWVDREVKPAGKEYEIQYSKKENDIYYDATIKTSGFTLEAPKIQIKENPFRIKINILSSVKNMK
jgi:hypothetical protein